MDLERSLRLKSDGPRYVNQFMERSRESITRLYSIVAYFGSEVSGSDASYKEVKESYRQGLQKYYVGDLPGALGFLEKTDSKANELLEAFSDIYRDRTQEILQKAADALVEKDISLMNEGAGQFGGTRDLQKNQFKTRIAFQQFGNAEDMRRRKMHGEAIEHMRVAKIHAINVLLDLAADENARKEINQTYKKDLEDAYGKAPVVNEAGQSGATK